MSLEAEIKNLFPKHGVVLMGPSCACRDFIADLAALLERKEPDREKLEDECDHLLSELIEEVGSERFEAKRWIDRFLALARTGTARELPKLDREKLIRLLDGLDCPYDEDDVKEFLGWATGSQEEKKAPSWCKPECPIPWYRLDSEAGFHGWYRDNELLRDGDVLDTRFCVHCGAARPQSEERRDG